MLFQWFCEPFYHFGPKSVHLALVFIRYFRCVCRLLKNVFFYLFYKVSRHGENATRKPALGNAFWMILEAFSTFWTDFLPFGIGFYKVFRMRFRTPQKAVFPLVFYKVFSICRIATRKPPLANAFSTFLDVFLHFWIHFLDFDPMFYKVFRMQFPTSRKVDFPSVL